MIIVNFKNHTTKTAYGLWQWDYGQVLRIEGLDLPTATEVHFSTQETGGESVTRIGMTKDCVTDVVIPDSLLENNGIATNYFIYAFIYITDATSGQTEYVAKLEVKSRPKPEAFDTPGDGELFREAIKAVNNSADRAETAANTSEQNAEKTAEDRTAIAEMVETVSGIEQQVQDVKKYAGQAKTAASNAALSEQKAKESETAALQAKEDAETAKGSAETAAGKTAEDRTAVESAKEEVLQAKQQVSTNRAAVEAVERKVAQMGNAIPQAVQAGVQAVGSAGAAEKQGIVQAGTEQKSDVESAGTKAVEDINLAKKTATDAVETAKTGAIKAVEDKGAEVLQSIPEDFTTQMVSKLDKQQGAENSGKILQIGEDGLIIPVEKPNDGGEKDYELISEITTSQEVSVLYINGFKKQFTEFILYITCPKAEQISVYIQRIFQNSKYGKAVVLYNISDAGKEIESVAKIELLAEKIEFVDCASNKYNSANIQRNYNNKYNDNTPIEKTSFKEIGISCTGAFKIPIGTKITLIGR